jgi:hypothetical protein
MWVTTGSLLHGFFDPLVASTISPHGDLVQNAELP